MHREFNLNNDFQQETTQLTMKIKLTYKLINV